MYHFFFEEQKRETANKLENFPAKQVAKDILNGAKTEYKNPSNDSRKEKHMQTYDMARDIHFIKNVMMFLVILTIIYLIGRVIGIVHIEKIWSDFIEQFSTLPM